MLNRIRTMRGEGGFTLIELLIVIVVLGILTGVTVLAVGGFQTAATGACNDVSSEADNVVAVATQHLKGSESTYKSSSKDCS